MAKVQHYINAINNTTDMDELLKIRKTLGSYTSGRNPNMAYVEPLDLVRRKLFDLYGIEMRKGVSSSKSPVSNTNSNRGDSPKPKDWEAEAMEWKRIAEGYREALEASQRREKELEEKLLGEEKMGKEWNDKFEMLSEKIRLAMEDYERDMKIMEEEIQAMEKEHARVLEERDLEAKEEKEALYETIEELEEENERLRKEINDRKPPQVSSKPISDAPGGEKIKGYSDSKMYKMLKGMGLEKYFVVYVNQKGDPPIYRIMYARNVMNTGHLGSDRGGYVDSRYYVGTDEGRQGIIDIIEENM